MRTTTQITNIYNLKSMFSYLAPLHRITKHHRGDFDQMRSKSQFNKLTTFLINNNNKFHTKQHKVLGQYLLFVFSLCSINKKRIICSIIPSASGIKFMNNIPKKRYFNSSKTFLTVPLIYNKVLTRSYSIFSCEHCQAPLQKNLICKTNKISILKRYTGSTKIVGKVIENAAKSAEVQKAAGASSQQVLSPGVSLPADSLVFMTKQDVAHYPVPVVVMVPVEAQAPVQMEGSMDPHYTPKILSEGASQQRPDLFNPTQHQTPAQTDTKAPTQPQAPQPAQVNDVPKPFTFGLVLPKPGLGSAAQANIKSTSTSSPIQETSVPTPPELSGPVVLQAPTEPLPQQPLPVPAELPISTQDCVQEASPSTQHHPTLPILEQTSTVGVEVEQPPQAPQPQPESSTEKMAQDHKKQVINQINKLSQGKNPDDNFRPSELPDSAKGSYSFPEKTQEPAQIDESIDTDQLLKEMLKRNLIKEDPKPSVTKILLADNSTVLVGEPKHKVKLSPQGQGYHEKYQSEVVTKNTSDIPIPGLSKPNFIIVAPPTSDDALFIETGQQKHMLVACNPDDGEYYAVGILTSKNSGTLLSEQQFKAFQNQKEGASPLPSAKVQKIMEFKVPKKINKDDIQRLKWDKEYIKSLPPNAKEELDTLWDKLREIPYEYFNKNGITKEEGIKMCHDHDKNIQNNVKHPLSKDQIKINEENKKNQHEKQQAKKNLPNNDNDKTVT